MVGTVGRLIIGRAPSWEQRRVAQPAQGGVQRHVPVGVDPGQLDPAVPDVTVDVVAGEREGEQPRQLDGGGDRQHGADPDSAEVTAHPPAERREHDGQAEQVPGPGHVRCHREHRSDVDADHDRGGDHHPRRRPPTAERCVHEAVRNEANARPPACHSSTRIRSRVAADSLQGEDSEAGPGHRLRAAVCVVQHQVVAFATRGIGVRLADDQSARSDQIATAPQHPRDVTADPDVAVEQQRGTPPTLPRKRVGEVATQDLTSLADTDGDGRPRDVDSQHGTAGVLEGRHHPTGPAADVDHRWLAARHHHGIDGVGRPEPAVPTVHELARRSTDHHRPDSARLHRARLRDRARLHRARLHGHRSAQDRTALVQLVEQTINRLTLPPRHQLGVPTREHQPRMMVGDPLRIGRLVDVAQRRQQLHRETEGAQPGQLGGGRAVRRHGNPGEDRMWFRRAEADRPESSVLAESEHGIRAAPSAVEQPGRHLWGVHSDQQHGFARTGGHCGGERRREPAAEVPGRLRHHVEAGIPAGRVAVPGQHSARCDTAPDRAKRVRQGGGGQHRRLLRAESAVQAGLHSARPGLLGQHDDRLRRVDGRPGVRDHLPLDHEASLGWGGRSITAVMSRTARQAPGRVPVTLDRPCRSR